jgi:hypothetical protein
MTSYNKNEMSTYSLGLNKHIILYSDFPQVRNSQIQIRKGIHDLLFVDGEEEVFDIPKKCLFSIFCWWRHDYFNDRQAGQDQQKQSTETQS